jgi:RND family efflux transporter MFP subunit
MAYAGQGVEMTVAVKLAAALVGLLALGACREQAEQPAPVRPVRTVVVQHTTDSDPITLTGQIQSRDQVNLAFRIDGRLVKRAASVGSVISAGAIVARLQDDDAQNALRTARASLSAAQGSLTQAEADEGRQKELLASGIIAKARYEQALQALQASQAQVDAAEAQVQSAEDTLSYTELKADSSGTVTATGAEVGEVVHAGQMVVQLAREGGKDAVFNVPAKMIRNVPDDPLVTVALADDSSITATGHVREVSPQAEATTGTYVVKVALTQPPQSMRLGATVTGSVSLSSEPVIRLPGTALTEVDSGPAVWVVDPATSIVSPREVSVLRYDSDAVIINDGLSNGEVVVTAGVHALRPGQKVRLPDRAS